jgi:uncharacterized protein (DUF4415 family)
MRRFSADTQPAIPDDAKARLQTLQAEPDDAIDLSDSPELSDAELSGAGRGRFYRPLKQQITARIDADVLAWLKADGKGYQSRLNAILRREMQASTTKKKAR